MVSLASVQTAIASQKTLEYQCLENLNVYDSPQIERLATQAIAHRQLKILPFPEFTPTALPIVLSEDDYPGWIAVEDLDLLEEAETNYRAIALSRQEIGDRIPQILAFVQAAMHQPNHYLWGGTVGPNYDCSGLVQTAFAAVGIWIPRDAYQQEAFVQKIEIGLPFPEPQDAEAVLDLASLQPGDLIFFGTPERCTHVGIHLGEGRYLHSSGKDQGRNGIGIDVLSATGDAVSQAYLRQLRSVGRVVSCYTGEGQ